MRPRISRTASMSMPLDALPSLSLAFDLPFEALYTVEGAAVIDARFFEYLSAADALLADRLATARDTPAALAPREEAELLIAVGPHVEDFLAVLFGIASEVRTLETA